MEITGLVLGSVCGDLFTASIFLDLVTVVLLALYVTILMVREMQGGERKQKLASVNEKIVSVQVLRKAA